MTPRVSIIIPVYNALAYAQQCLAAIYQSRTNTAFEVIVVNNGSRPDVADWLQQAARTYPHLRALHYPEPLGFARAVNEGARLAQGEFLAIVNSDAVPSDHWLDALVAALTSDPQLAVVSPLTNHCGNPAQVAADSAHVTPETTNAFADELRANPGILNEPQRLMFFCVLVRRTAWDLLAGLDETYRQGNYEDDDFCLRARLAGFRLAIVRHSFVLHHEQQTFRGNRIDHGEALARNRETFLKRLARWSTSPPFPITKSALDGLCVLIPAHDGDSPQLARTLASLAQQSVTGFPVLLAGAHATHPHLSIQHVATPAHSTLSQLLNALLQAAGTRSVAFCLPGDVLFPFHLEVLSAAAREHQVVCSAWCCTAGTHIATPRFDQCGPAQTALGDWVPLSSIVAANASQLPPFPAVSDAITSWLWTHSIQAHALQRVTLLKQPRALSLDEANLAFQTLGEPASKWHQEERKQFLKGVSTGSWERYMILDRAEVERRARALLAGPKPLTADPRQLQTLSKRLRYLTGRITEQEQASRLPDVVLFNIVGWDHLVQRPHHLARGLARQGYRVFWIDTRLQNPETTDTSTLIRALEPNLHYVELPATDGELYLLEWSPDVLDAMLVSLQYLARRLDMQDVVQLVNYPKWTPLVLRLKQDLGWPIVYDCLDNQQAFGELFRNNEAHFEDNLIAASASLITSGQVLYNLHHEKHSDTTLISNATDFQLFANASAEGILPDVKGPVAGFYGAFSGWLDRAWIAEAARRFPHVTFVYIGREGFARGSSAREWKAATTAPNIRVLPQMDLPELARYLARFDLCLMPFLDLPVTRSMNAVKLFEYLAAGKPILVPDLPETRPLARAGLLEVYRDHEESFTLLAQALARSSTPAEVLHRQQFAAENTWQHRVTALEKVLVTSSKKGRTSGLHT